MDINREAENIQLAIEERLKNITLKPIDTKKKGILKGFKIAAVPNKLLEAFVRPYNRFIDFLEKHFGSSDEVSYDELTNLQIMNSFSEKKVVEPDFEESLVNKEAEVTPVSTTEVEVTAEPTLTTEVSTEPVIEPTLTAEPVLTEEEPQKEFNYEAEVETTDFQPTVEPEITTETTLVQEEVKEEKDLLTILEEKRLKLKETLKVLKSKNKTDLIDDIIDMEDELEEVEKQISAELELREAIQKEKDAEALLNAENTSEVVPVIEKSIINERPHIFTTMASFLGDIVEDKKVENMEIDEQIEILIKRKETNNNIIAKYEPYIQAHLKGETELSEEDKRKIDAEKIREEIGYVKAELEEKSYNAGDKLQKYLHDLETRYANLTQTVKTK